MENKGYNGWKNYETWVVNLWMDNEKGTYDYWREQAQEAYDNCEADKTFTKLDRAKLSLSDALKAYHEEALPEIEGFASDLLSAAMSEVDWYEIAEHLLDEVDKAEQTA